ncbi:hypothetical protein F5Y06DRAFT_308273 [Hypoxylon sp. FL0890]|nr:hypothetical protein F5Y06DRAFT_308273 [Hypoxylon sp. FL0890]
MDPSKMAPPDLSLPKKPESLNVSRSMKGPVDLSLPAKPPTTPQHQLEMSMLMTPASFGTATPSGWPTPPASSYPLPMPSSTPSQNRQGALPESRPNYASGLSLTPNPPSVPTLPETPPQTALARRGRRQRHRRHRERRTPRSPPGESPHGRSRGRGAPRGLHPVSNSEQLEHPQRPSLPPRPPARQAEVPLRQLVLQKNSSEQAPQTQQPTPAQPTVNTEPPAPAGQQVPQTSGPSRDPPPQAERPHEHGHPEQSASQASNGISRHFHRRLDAGVTVLNQEEVERLAEYLDPDMEEQRSLVYRLARELNWRERPHKLTYQLTNWVDIVDQNYELAAELLRQRLNSEREDRYGPTISLYKIAELIDCQLSIDNYEEKIAERESANRGEATQHTV